VNGVKEIKTIGLPRGLMLYRQGILWKTFFETLGYTCVVSEKSDKNILDMGTALAIDETCLPFKMYLGHVKSLEGRCDAVFAPRMGGYYDRERTCTRYQSLPDLVTNIFRDTGIRVLTVSYDWYDKIKEKDVYMKLGAELGKSRKESARAYAAAREAQMAWREEKERRQAKKMEKPGMKVMLAGHPYVLHDQYMGSELARMIKSMGAEVLYSDYVSQEETKKYSYHFSKVMPWIINREMTGSVMMMKEKVDGIVLVSAYPCGPDALVNDMLVRKIKNIPMLSLTLDAQSGTAGMETRIESFIDIITYQKAGGYENKN